MLFPYWPPGVYWFDRVQVILGAGVAPASNPDRLETEYRAARDQIRLFVAALERYRESAGSYPTTLQGLKALREKPQREPVPSNWQGPYLDDSIPLDPWGMRYRYFSPGSARPEAFDLSSTGPDRKAGGGDGVEYLGEGWKDE
ncbi:MAG: type II secretion system major pseudopilin GspG [Planctomycetes bacterium]|nr:type II secretion system major pseudopilin GspG [Planctomycetota bacterium]